jgi:hypothetical protein
MTQDSRVRSALEKAIKRMEAWSVQFETTGTLDSSSKADAAIKKLRKDRRLSMGELNRPMMGIMGT